MGLIGPCCGWGRWRSGCAADQFHVDFSFLPECFHRFFMALLVAIHRFFMAVIIATMPFFRVSGTFFSVSGTIDIVYVHDKYPSPNSNSANIGWDVDSGGYFQAGLLESYRGLLKFQRCNFEFTHRLCPL